MDHHESNYRNAFRDFQRAAQLDGETVLIRDPDYGVGRRHCLFVYGTMKKGFRNHGRLVDRAHFIGNAVTADACYELMTKQGAYVAPVMMKQHGPHGYRVAGEVYEVSGPLLGIIDGYEGHPVHYQRERIVVRGVQGFVWAYLFDMNRTAQLRHNGIDLNSGTKTFTVKE